MAGVRLQSFNPLYGRNSHNLLLLFQHIWLPDQKITVLQFALPSRADSGTERRRTSKGKLPKYLWQTWQTKPVFPVAGPACCPVTCHIIRAWFELWENFYGLLLGIAEGCCISISRLRDYGTSSLPRWWAIAYDFCSIRQDIITYFFFEWEG